MLYELVHTMQVLYAFLFLVNGGKKEVYDEIR